MKFPKKYSLAWCYTRIIHQRGTPNFIAGGTALGLVIGLVVPISSQLLIAIPLAYLLKVSKLAASIATMITNPITILVIYPVQIYVGQFIITFSPPNYETIKKSIGNIDSFSAFCNAGLWEIIIPFFIGGTFFAIIIAPIGYYLTLKYVNMRRKQKFLKKKIALENFQNIHPLPPNKS